MIYFAIEVIDRENGNNLFSRKSTAWETLPRVGEQYYLSSDIPGGFEEVTGIWHYAEHEPSYISVEFEVDHKDFLKLLEDKLSWTQDQQELWRWLQSH